MTVMVDCFCAELFPYVCKYPSLQEMKASNQHLTVHDEKRSWADAQKDCASLGAHLAFVNSRDEWEDLLETIGRRQMVWLGGTDAEVEGAWRWTDGSPWSYTSWGNHAGNDGRGKDCVKGFRSFMMDWLCDELNPYVCKYPGRLISNVCNCVITCYCVGGRWRRWRG